MSELSAPKRRIRRGMAAALLALAGCSPSPPPAEETRGPAPPSILLVTLDTTRADATGLESDAIETPSLEALAARGVVFPHAYATAPTTLPSHASMLTGLYPAEHGVRENARRLAGEHELLAERLRERGYATAAFVSGLPLAARFGLARGFDRYDDDFAAGADSGEAERGAAETTERALLYLKSTRSPLFLWVHYFDPHDPYDPPEPFRSRYADAYLAEIAAADHALGRLVAAFEERFGESGWRAIVAGDHGEGRGDHGEAFHGNLLYQGVMRVPLVVAGSGVEPGRRERPVSLRRVFDTVLAWAGEERPQTLLEGAPEVVLAEAMKPHLQYGWQPQVMAVWGRTKVIRSGELEVYDLAFDPGETANRAGRVEIDADVREALAAYPLLPERQAEAGELSREDRARLASLGYTGWSGALSYRLDGPSPKDMTHLFPALDAGSEHFLNGRYELAARVFEEVLEEDPHNLMVLVRLAVAHSFLGRDARALELFERARALAPESPDVDHYLAMHHFRLGRLDAAGPLFERVVEAMPERVAALERLAEIRAEEGRLGDARRLLERAAAVEPSPDLLARLGELAMAEGDTPAALAAFEEARVRAGEDFEHWLELGVLYLTERRFAEARNSLDRVPPEHPAHAMALFKRAQVSALLGEADRDERVRRAYREGDDTTRRLIENEALFRGVALE